MGSLWDLHGQAWQPRRLHWDKRRFVPLAMGVFFCSYNISFVSKLRRMAGPLSLGPVVDGDKTLLHARPAAARPRPCDIGNVAWSGRLTSQTMYTEQNEVNRPFRLPQRREKGVKP